jgi:hypothetical protein
MSPLEGGWRIEDTTAIVRRTRTSVIDDLARAKALENFPILANCRTKNDVNKAVKGLQRMSHSVEGLSSFDEKMKDGTDQFEMYHGDS